MLVLHSYEALSANWKHVCKALEYCWPIAVDFRSLHLLVSFLVIEVVLFDLNSALHLTNSRHLILQPVIVCHQTPRHYQALQNLDQLQNLKMIIKLS
jgi:hypothetical protein